jgi:hypothetical protein
VKRDEETIPRRKESGDAMAITCSRCGAEFDATLFEFGHRVRCRCGVEVEYPGADLRAGHVAAEAVPGGIRPTAQSRRGPIAPRAAERSPTLLASRALVHVRLLLGFFAAALVASGLTAFPLTWETRLLDSWFGEGTRMASVFPALAWWLSHVHQGLESSYGSYPFLAYGTDWLAFAHLVIAVAFWGPIKDPARNVWVVDFGIIACVLVVPLALVCGPIRGIPWFWRLIDCAFGVIGLIPLVLARRIIRGQLAEDRER